MIYLSPLSRDFLQRYILFSAFNHFVDLVLDHIRNSQQISQSTISNQQYLQMSVAPVQSKIG